MTTPAASKGEHNFVADAHNWEQRIKTENEAAQIWSNNWGSLYVKDAPTTYAGKIAQLEAEIKKIPTASLATNTMLSYMGDKPFVEIKKAVSRRRRSEMFPCPLAYSVRPNPSLNLSYLYFSRPPPPHTHLSPSPHFPVVQNYGKKTFGKFEHIDIPGFKEELDPKYRPST